MARLNLPLPGRFPLLVRDFWFCTSQVLFLRDRISEADVDFQQHMQWHPSILHTHSELLICLFVFGCARSLLLLMGFLQLQQAGLRSVAVLGFLTAAASLVEEHRLQGTQARQLCRTGLVALWRVRSSQTRDRTHVPCIGRQVPWATREVQRGFF